MKSKSIWIVYRPVMDYEESEETYFACETQERALEAQKIMLDFLAQKLKECPEAKFPQGYKVVWYSLSDAERNEFMSKNLKRTEFICDIKDWPFEVDLSEWLYKDRVEEGCVSIAEIPIY